MIIDDGSEDSTEKLVSQWISERKIDIVFFKKENGGKASALNFALDYLNTEYVVCLDSDDLFYPNAVEKAIVELEKTSNVNKICGILALRNNPDGTVMGKNEIPRNLSYVTASDIFLQLRLRTELICFYKSDIIKQYRFPIFEGEKFISPAWMQYKITQEYKYKVSREKYCQCEYFPDGLTKNKRKVIFNNPKGYTCIKKFSFDLAPTMKLRIKHGIMYDCGCILAKDKEWLKNVKHKVMAIVLYPMAMVISKYRFKEF